MNLKPLYTVRFIYPQGWEVARDGPGGHEEQHFYLAEGRVEGGLEGTFRAANYPRRRVDRTFVMDMRGFIALRGGGLVMVEYRGYGRAYPPGRRQVVGSAIHTCDVEAFRHLNDTICVLSGEVRVPSPPPEPLEQKDVQLVFDVAELVWEPPGP